MHALRTIHPIPFAWLQLAHQPLRLTIAIAGVVFAVVLIFMQLGFQAALYRSAARLHEIFHADLVLLHPKYLNLMRTQPFSQRRLFQVRAHRDVASISPVYAQVVPWKNPHTGDSRGILVVGVDPTAEALAHPMLRDQIGRLRRADTALFDLGSRPGYGMSADDPASNPRIVEIANRRITLDGTFHLGGTFAVDGNLITGHATFLSILPQRSTGMVDFGLVRLRPGANADAVRADLAARFPADVEVLTKSEFVAREQGYWRRNTPIGYIFGFGVIMGFFVGAVIVYQVLFVNVSDHLTDYATLKAIGFPDAALFVIVIEQALLLATVGFVPGVALSAWLYGLTGAATHLPMQLNPGTAVFVFGLTASMCCLSGLAALRKVRAADPAEVFA